MTTDSLSPNEPSLDVLDRYLAGEATLAERAVVQAWVRELPSAAARTTVLERVLASDPAYQPVAPRMAQMWAQRIVAGDAAPHPSDVRMTRAESDGRAQRPMRELSNPWWRPGIAGVAWAGVALAGVVAAVAILVARDHRAPSAVLDEAVYTTTTGQHAHVVLRDGSQIDLAPESQLRVASGFGGHERAMTLRGQAYFQVVADAKAPFVVRTGAVATRVLGTTFDIQHYPNDAGVRVAVVSGKVSVEPARRPGAVVLSANQAVLATDSSTTSLAAGAAAAQWTDGRLVFNDALASEVLAALTRWYGYHFTLTDSTLARRNLTVGLSTESSQRAFASLELAWDVELRFDGNTVVVSPRRGGTGRTGASRAEPITPKQDEVGQ